MQAQREKDAAAGIVADEDEEEDKESDEERPTSIVQPKYKIVHSYPHEIMDAWEGHQGTLE